MERDSEHNNCNCHLSSANVSVHQTLSEMDWERGIWNAGTSFIYLFIINILLKVK